MIGSSTRRAPHGRRWIATAGLPLTVALSLSTLFLGCATKESSAGSSSGSTTSVVATTTTMTAPARLEVVATDYEWSGLPDRLPEGSYPLTLGNSGSEVHEIQVFKNTENLTLKALSDLGPIVFKDHVELAGGTIVGPGGTSEPTMLRLTKGTYEVVCFVPAATDQRPHFDHGMHQTLTVG